MKKNTPESAEAAERRHQREGAEIIRLEKERSRSGGKYYLPLLMIIITIIYITDEVTTQIGTQMKTEIANTIFSGFGDRSISMMDIVSYASYAISIPALFYKTLADRFGRKVFLFVNTVGMGLGMAVMFLAHNIPMYVIGAMLIAFFTPHDMQVVYIMETAPQKKRAIVYSVIKAIATLGVFIIPLCRKLFMTSVDKWNLVYLIPAIVGLVIALFALLFARETGPFIESRLKFLRHTDEERAAEAKAKKADSSQYGLKSAFVFAFSHKQLRWLFISGAVNGLATVVTSYYSVIMTYGYARSALAAGQYADMDAALSGVSVTMVTTALFMFPFFSALIQFINGFIADLIGRKTSVISMYSISLVSFILFTYGAYHGWSPYVVGSLSGLLIGAFWAGGDVLGGMMVSESSPTHLRSSMLSAQAMANGVGAAVGVIGIVSLIAVFGNSFVWKGCLIFAIPGIAVSLILMAARTSETKGMDISTVRGDEWDEKKAEGGD